MNVTTRLRRAAPILALLLILAIRPTPARTDDGLNYRAYLPMVVKPRPPVEILSANLGGTSSSGLWTTVLVVGEVRNNTPGPLTAVRIEGTSTAGIAAHADLDTPLLNPGDRGTFTIAFVVQNVGFVPCNTPPYTHLAIAGYAPAPAPAVPLALVSETATQDAGGYHVGGVARNATAGTVFGTRAFVRLYNSAGEMIGKEWSLAMPTLLEPGDQAAYAVTVVRWSDCPGSNHTPVRYELQVLGYP